MIFGKCRELCNCNHKLGTDCHHPNQMFCAYLQLMPVYLFFINIGKTMKVVWKLLRDIKFLFSFIKRNWIQIRSWIMDCGAQVHGLASLCQCSHCFYYLSIISLFNHSSLTLPDEEWKAKYFFFYCFLSLDFFTQLVWSQPIHYFPPHCVLLKKSSPPFCRAKGNFPP